MLTQAAEYSVRLFNKRKHMTSRTSSRKINFQNTTGDSLGPAQFQTSSVPRSSPEYSPLGRVIPFILRMLDQRLRSVAHGETACCAFTEVCDDARQAETMNLKL